jgi:hypothetical protein
MTKFSKLIQLGQLESSGMILLAVSLTLGCSGGSSHPATGDAGSTGGKSVVINEVFANGSSPAAPDWVELKNLTAAAIDLGGYQMRDNLVADLTKLPAGTSIDPGAYLVIYCDDQADGGIPSGVHLPFKLSSSKGDEVHLLDPAGVEVDMTIFGADVPSDKSWGRLPDGTGGFVRTTPTEGQPNL